MRLQPKMHSDSALLQPLAAFCGDAADAQLRTNYRPVLLRSNMPAKSISDPGVDFVAPERQAGIARSTWVGSKLKSYYQALVLKFERAGSAGLENYLAASQNLAQLEERIRRYERMQALYY